MKRRCQLPRTNHLVRIQHRKIDQKHNSLQILTRTNATIKNVRSRLCNDSIDSSNGPIGWVSFRFVLCVRVSEVGDGSLATLEFRRYMLFTN